MGKTKEEGETRHLRATEAMQSRKQCGQRREEPCILGFRGTMSPHAQLVTGCGEEVTIEWSGHGEK